MTFRNSFREPTCQEQLRLVRKIPVLGRIEKINFYLLFTVPLFVLFLHRLEKEKGDAYSDVDRSRDKYEKLQVSSVSAISRLFFQTSLCGDRVGKITDTLCQPLLFI
jgi:hypothetical protein